MASRKQTRPTKSQSSLRRKTVGQRPATPTTTQPAHKLPEMIESAQPLSPGAVLQMQRLVGNRATNQQLQRTTGPAVSSTSPRVQRMFNYANGQQMSNAAREQIIPIWQHKAKFGEFLTLSNTTSPLAPTTFEAYLATSGLSEADVLSINAIIEPDMAREEEADLGLEEAHHGGGGAGDLILNWEDLQWIEKSQLAFRFHTSSASLEKEAQSKRMGGHKHPMYYMQDVFAAVGVDAENLSEVPSEKREEIIREYQRRILALSQASLVHVDNGEFVSAGFIIAKLEKDERALMMEKFFGKGQSNLIDGLKGTPFGAYLGDAMSEGLDPGKFIVKEIGVCIDSKESFLQHKWRLSDMVIEYVKKRGAVKAFELSGKTPKSISVADPESPDYIDPKKPKAEEESGALGIPGLRELTEEEIAERELQELAQRAEAIKELEKSMAEVNRLAIIQAKLLGGGGLDSGDIEFLKEQFAKRKQ